MGKIADKTILIVISIFAMYPQIYGNIFVALIYGMIAYSAAALYLMGEGGQEDILKRMILTVLEVLVALIAMIIPQAIILLPIVFYDTRYSRNYIAGVIGILSICHSIMDVIKSGNTEGLYYILLIVMLTTLGIYLSFRTSEYEKLQTDQRRLRDDSVEQERKLGEQNVQLINARDNEISAAQVAERNRIAREIHDNVGHMLSRAILQLGALLVINKQEPINSQLTELKETLDSAMNNIRTSVHDLHDDSLNVPLMMEELAKPLRQSGKYKVNLELDIEDMPREIKYAVIGITKECVSNIIKHSKNKTVDIKLIEHPVMYQLVVHDYDETVKSVEIPKNSQGSGIGLANIESRVESVNGRLDINGDNGFRVFVSIPK